MDYPEYQEYVRLDPGVDEEELAVEDPDPGSEDE